MTSSFDLSEETIREYRKNGAVCLRNVFSKEWLEVVQKGIEKNMTNPGPNSEILESERGGPGKYFTDFANWWRISEFGDFVRNSPTAEIVASLLGAR